MFTNLLIVVAAGLLAPLALGFFPRVRLPAIVLEIVLGIVIGPSGLGWVKPDAPVSILALVGQEIQMEEWSSPFDLFAAQRQPMSIARIKGETPFFAASIERHALRMAAAA